jgi:hypothetical protein
LSPPFPQVDSTLSFRPGPARGSYGASYPAAGVWAGVRAGGAGLAWLAWLAGRSRTELEAAVALRALYADDGAAAARVLCCARADARGGGPGGAEGEGRWMRQQQLLDDLAVLRPSHLRHYGAGPAGPAAAAAELE